MKPKTIPVLLIFLLAAGALAVTGVFTRVLTAQTPVDISGIIKEGQKPAIAVPDFRGAGGAQQVMNAFNETLWSELDGSGILKMIGKTYYPLQVPQQPSDFKPPTAAGQSTGMWLTDWSGAPVNANDLAFGYTGVTPDGRLVLYGWLYNLSQPTPASATLIPGTRYFGSLNDDGAKKVAREFAADILKQFGAVSLAGTKIFFVSDRTGPNTLLDVSKNPVKEIWSMDYDGSNQRQLTNYKALSTQPAVSPDGKLFAFSTYPQLIRDGHTYEGQPQIEIHSVETGRKQTFYNPVSSVVETPEFEPDGQHLLFSARLDDDPQICRSNLQGGDFQRISHVRFIEVSPKVNPKTGRDVLFISGRSGHEQLWRMNIDGSGAEMLTTGEGDVANPAWSPNGQKIVFAWTRGYDIGGFNIFIMDIGSRAILQITRGGTGKNENPWWAPDGLHIVFASTRGRSSQIYSMLSDGSHVQQLTTQGNNFQPVWAKAIN
jgi:TolB protein